MRPKKLFLILIVVSLSGLLIPVHGQVKITDGSNLTLDPNSLLELESTTRGLLIPRVAINNLTQAAPLTAPVPAGMMVYSFGGSVTNGFYYWNGTSWTPFGSQWITNGTNIYYNTGNVGIGTSTPAEKLEVNGDIKIGSTTTGTIRATTELVLRQDGDIYGPSILRIRNRTGENGAIFETTDPSITLIDFIFKDAANQRNIRYESRASYARAGAPSFHIGGASPDNPTLALGDNYAAFNKNVRIGDYNSPLTALDVNGQITLRTGAANGAVLISNASGTGTWTAILPVASGGTGSSTKNFVDLTTAQSIGGVKTFTSTISASNLSGTNTGDQTITLTGNVTGSGTGSFAATIANNAVTYAKMQAISATSRLLGSSSTTTPVQEITLGSGLTMTGTTISAAASTFANPAATIGLTAVNGSATNAMRSDAAPALSQAIVPTWTGAHTWSALGTFNLGLAASGAAINFNVNSNFNTNINSGTSTGVVNIGNSTGLGGVSIGGGAAIKQVFSASADLDFPNIGGSSSSTLTISVIGAADGDPVFLGVPQSAMLPNLIFTAWVSAPDEVSVQCSNNTLFGSLNPASGTFRVTVFHY
jgi:hypothetical protein